MLGTGSIMKWFEPFPLDWRTGATFVHDWFALGIWIAVVGHILFALRDPDALGGDAARHGHRPLGPHATGRAGTRRRPAVGRATDRHAPTESGAAPAR